MYLKFQLQIRGDISVSHFCRFNPGKNNFVQVRLANSSSTFTSSSKRIAGSSAKTLSFQIWNYKHTLYEYVSV